jgi:hypothetical protein
MRRDSAPNRLNCRHWPATKAGLCSAYCSLFRAGVTKNRQGRKGLGFLPARRDGGIVAGRCAQRPEPRLMRDPDKPPLIPRASTERCDHRSARAHRSPTRKHARAASYEHNRAAKDRNARAARRSDCTAEPGIVCSRPARYGSRVTRCTQERVSVTYSLRHPMVTRLGGCQRSYLAAIGRLGRCRGS